MSPQTHSPRWTWLRSMPCKACIATATALLAACTLPGPMAAKSADIDGQTYLVTPLTAGTWTVTAKALRQPLPRTPASTAAMVKAVETASGCKVTDSDYSQDGLQLDAQVDCAGLKS